MVIQLQAIIIYIISLCRTLPTLNIFLYNAIGSANGDELYGVEPASYYFKNLFLNTGVAWPLMLCCPIVSALDFVITKRRDLDGYFLTILLSAALWLGVLFSRPHKVRYLYCANGNGFFYNLQ